MTILQRIRNHALPLLEQRARDAADTRAVALYETVRRQCAEAETKQGDISGTGPEIVMVRTHSELDSAVEYLSDLDEIAVDIETSGFDPQTDTIVGIGLGTDERVHYVPIAHVDARGNMVSGQLPEVAALDALRPVLESKRVIVHNAKFECAWFESKGIRLRLYWDTMVSDYLLKSHEKHSLKAAAVRELDVPDWSLGEEEIGDIASAPIEKAARYCGQDVRRTWELYQNQKPKIEERCEFLFHEVEMPLIEVIMAMEGNGYALDKEHFAEVKERAAGDFVGSNNKLQEIWHEGGGKGEFNPASPAQVAALLYGRCGLVPPHLTDGGQPSVDKRALKALKDQHPAVELIQRHRKVSKIATTYANLPEKADPTDGRLHVGFGQTTVETGRLQSSSVMQTIPRANSDEYHIREGFRASDGHVIVAADFDQQELRILAYRSGDPAMLAAIGNGEDLHGLAACKVFGLDCHPNGVKAKHPDQRSRVKAIQFGIVYGRSAPGIAAALDISVDEAKQLLDDYFARFAGVKAFIEATHRFAAANGYVDDLFGRRRYFRHIRYARPRKKWAALSQSERKRIAKANADKRAAQNFVIQGPAATITKMAMNRCYRFFRERYPGIRMILQLHDECQFEVPEEDVTGVCGELPRLMTDLELGRFGMKVPMAIEIKTGPSWGRLAKWEVGHAA